MATFVPSFWDSLSQGFDKGMSFYERERARKLAEEQAEFGRNTQMFQLLQGVAGQGGMVNDQLNALAGKMGIEGFQAPETPGQAQQQYFKMPETTTKATQLNVPLMDGITGAVSGDLPFDIPSIKGRDSVSDDRARWMGVRTSNERAQDRVTGTKLGVQEQALAGKEVDPYIAQLSDVMDKGGFELDRSTKETEALTAKATHYVTQSVNQLKAPITRDNVDSVAQSAYAEWLSTEGGKMPPEMKINAQAYFASAARNLYLQDEKNRLDQEELRLRQMVAGRSGAARPPDPIELVRAFTGLANSQRQLLRDKYQGDYELLFDRMNRMTAANKDAILKTTPKLAEFIADYGELQRFNSMNAQVANAIGASMGLIDPATTGQTLPAGPTLSAPGATPSATPNDATSVPQRDSDGRFMVTQEQADRIKAAGNWDDGMYRIVRQ